MSTEQLPTARTALVVPCFNEAHRLRLDAWEQHLASHSTDWLFFVNDGSTDNTLELLNTLAAKQPRARVISLPQNGGKAAAVRAGVLAASHELHCEFIGFWDADLSTSLELVEDFLAAFVRQPEASAAIGVRERGEGREIRRSRLRYFTSWAFAQAASQVIGLRLRDTQCGAKLFRGKIAEALFQQPFLTPWLFDIEVLARLIHLVGRPRGRQAIAEVRLREWSDVGESRFFRQYALQAPRDLLRIWWRY